MSFAIKRSKFRGDPGLFSTLGGLAAKGIGYAQQLGVLPGGGMPVPQVLPPGPAGIQINPPLLGPPGMGIQVALPGGAEIGFGVGELEEAWQAVQPGQAPVVTNGARGAIAPGGYHWNKSGYFVKGPPSGYVPEGTKLVKNRRRNPLNPRALDRAMGRITSAKRASSKLGRITIRKTCSHK